MIKHGELVYRLLSFGTVKENIAKFQMNNFQYVVKLLFYYCLNYFFTVVYNVYNKKVLMVLPLPATVAAVQLFLGIPLFLPIWLAKYPKGVSHLSKWSLTKVSLTHALGNLATVYSLGSGSVSFTHVIKAAEPLFSAGFSAFLMKSVFSIEVYASLIPIVFGVALASMKEASFSWFGFLTGMISNFFYQLRMVLSKQILDPNASIEKVSSANLFRIVTIYASFQLLPIVLLVEGARIIPTWKESITATNQNELLLNLLISGFSFYIYNEIAFWILDLVHPITHAVGNTIKRIVLIVAAIIIFKTPITLEGCIGSVIAVGGSFLYALAHHRYETSKQSSSSV